MVWRLGSGLDIRCPDLLNRDFLGEFSAEQLMIGLLSLRKYAFGPNLCLKKVRSIGRAQLDGAINENCV